MNNVSVCIYTNLTHTYTQLLDRRNKAPTHHTHNPYTYTHMYIVMDGRNNTPTHHTHNPYTYTHMYIFDGWKEQYSKPPQTRLNRYT